MTNVTSIDLLYSIRDKSAELNRIRYQMILLPLVFSNLPESVTKDLDNIRPQQPVVVMPEINKNRSVVTRPYPQLVLISSYENWSLLFSASRWAEPKLGMEQCRSENKGTLYVETTLKERRTEKFSLEIGASAEAHDNKEEDIMDETDPNPSSTFSEKKSTVRSKRVK